MKGATPFVPDAVEGLEAPEVDDPEERGPPAMIPGHELLGDVPVVFQPQNVKTMARVGQPLSEVASQADVFIRYKCRKGECKTCVVNIDGKWVSACQTKIPPRAPGEQFDVRVRPVSDAHKHQEKAAFFSPKSIADGFMNNALGMAGFAQESAGADPDFQVRIERERAIEELVARRRAERKSLRGVPGGEASAEGARALAAGAAHRGSQAVAVEEPQDSSQQLFVPALFATAFFMIALIQH